jgi:hypothetical protein
MNCDGENSGRVGGLADPQEGPRGRGSSRIENNMKRTLWICALIFAVLPASLFILWPPMLIIPLEQNQFLDVWRFRFLLTFRIPLAVLLGLLSLLTIGLGRTLIPSSIWAHRLEPLALLPWITILQLFADRLGSSIAANALFFGPILVAAAIATRWLVIPSPVQSEVHHKKTVWLIFILTVIIFSGMGIFFSYLVGEHAGDEAHYLIQTESLFKDGDLAVNNQLGPLPSSAEDRRAKLSYMHMIENPATGNIYSYHPWGLSLLAAPIGAVGMIARQILLALIAAAGCAGMFLLCRRTGAGTVSSLIATISLTISFYWAIYSIRFLPEVLGATLLVWTFWAIAIQRDRPWASLAVAILCCSYLPVVHTRFIPAAAMGAGFYGLAGLFGSESRPRKLARLGLLAFLCTGSLLALIAIQKHLYGSGPYAVGSILFEHPIAAWAIFFDSQGLLSVLPVFVWYAAAALIWLMIDREQRFMSAALVLTFGTVLLTSCTNIAALGGACVPGRYLLVAMPLLLPGTAHLLERASSMARLWFFFLAGISCVMLLFTFVHLPEIERAFNLPHQRLMENPLFNGLFNPFASLIYPRDATAPWYASAFVAVLLLATFLLLLLPAKQRFAGAALFGLILAAGLLAHHHPFYRASLNRVARQWDLRHAMFDRRPASEPMALFHVSRQVFRDTLNRPTLTTRDLGTERRGNLYSQPRLGKNDWDGRAFGWLTLTAPFKAPAGQIALRMLGAQTGQSEIIIAIRQGRHLLYEGKPPIKSRHLDATWVLPVADDGGNIYILARLEGEGEFKLEQMYYTPALSTLLHEAQLYLPKETIVVKSAITP